MTDRSDPSGITRYFVEDTGDGSQEDRVGYRWGAVLEIKDPQTGLSARHVMARCSTREIAQAVCKWADAKLDGRNDDE